MTAIEDLIEVRVAKRNKQLELIGNGMSRPGDQFGGALLKGNPKGKRPLESKFPILLTMRAQKSVLRLPKTYKIVRECIDSTAKKYGVKVYEDANVGNHLHLVIKLHRISLWAPFIRELSGRIAQQLEEILHLEMPAKFWKFRPHTRIIRGWQKAFRIALDYIFLNQMEAEGNIKRSETKTLADYRAIFAVEMVRLI